MKKCLMILVMASFLWLAACHQPRTGSMPAQPPDATITVALARTDPQAMSTADQNSDVKCRQTIYDVYNRTYCPDREQVLENLFAPPFELNKQAWMAACENGPFTQVVEIDGPISYTAKSYSYSVVVRFWYPEGKGSGTEPYTSVIFISTAMGEDGGCRVTGATGGG